MSRLLRSLRRNWLAALFGFALCMIIAAAAAFLPSKQYQAGSTVLVMPNVKNPKASQYEVAGLLPSVPAQVQSLAVQTAALRLLSPDVAGQQVTVDATIEPGTSILDIHAQGTDKSSVAQVANAYTQALIASQPTDGPLEIELLNPAVPPSSPSSPDVMLIMVTGFGLGLIVGLFSALAAQSFTRHQGLSDEIRERFGLQVLGEIPSFSRKRSTRQALQVTGDDPFLVEAFMLLRTNVEIALATRALEAVTITSRSISEGKSTVVANLGWVLASAGHRIALVDGDLRRPSLHEYFNQRTGRRSVGGPLDGELEVTRTALPSLVMVPAATVRALDRHNQGRVGPGERHPAEIVTSELPRVLAGLTGPDRLVVVDAPPLLGAAETRLIMQQTTAVILVLDVSRRSALDELEKTLRQVVESGAEVLGVVLNRARIRRSHARQVQQYYAVRPAPQGQTAPDRVPQDSTLDGAGSRSQSEQQQPVNVRSLSW